LNTQSQYEFTQDTHNLGMLGALIEYTFDAGDGDQQSVRPFWRDQHDLPVRAVRRLVDTDHRVASVRRQAFEGVGPFGT
jgi:hypothetical protein